MKAAWAGLGFRWDVGGDPFEFLPVSLVWFAATQWAQFAENNPNEGVCLGDETWRHDERHLSAGGTVVFFCIRSQTRSVLALLLFFMRRRRGDMPLGRALQLVAQHMDLNPPWSPRAVVVQEWGVLGLPRGVDSHVRGSAANRCREEACDNGEGRCGASCGGASCAGNRG